MVGSAVKLGEGVRDWSAPERHIKYYYIKICVYSRSAIAVKHWSASVGIHFNFRHHVQANWSSQDVRLQLASSHTLAAWQWLCSLPRHAIVAPSCSHCVDLVGRSSQVNCRPCLVASSIADGWGSVADIGR